METKIELIREGKNYWAFL